MKPYYTSKLFYLGLLGMTIATLQLAQSTDWADPWAWCTFAIGVLTIVSRWVTDTPITSLSPKLDKLRPKTIKRLEEREKQALDNIEWKSRE